MKLKNYEKKGTTVFFIIILLLGVLLLTIFTFFYKMPAYYAITGVVFKDDLIEVMITDEELKKLHNNRYLYIHDKKYKYNIKEVVEKALVQNNKNYNLIYIECLLNEEKENDVIEMVFRNQNIKLFKIFEVMWG